MKKLSYILLVAVTILVSCRKHDTLQESPEDAWIYDMSLPVPIQFGNFGPTTKAIVEGDELPIDAVLGICAFNKNQATSVDYSLAGDNMLLNNELTKVEGNKLKFSEDQYYPLESSMNFTFTGYYPRHTVEELTVTNFSNYYDASSGKSAPGVKSVYVTRFDIGKDDILWAESKAMKTPTDGIDGYNAKYIRAINKDDKIDEATKDGYMPNLNFEHKLTALRFKVKLKDELNSTSTSNVKVETFAIKNTPIKVSLVVASVHPDYPVGMLTPKQSTADNIIYVLKSPGSGISPTKDEGTKLGELLLFPQSSYECEMGIKGSNGKLQPSKFTITADGEGFQAGKIYDLTITVHKDVVIDITYTLTDWEDGKENITFEKEDGSTSNGTVEIG